MILLLSITIIAVLVFFIALWRQSQAKRYEDPHFNDNLIQIDTFFTEINTLQGYFPWIKREEIKSKYQALWQFFKHKSKYYKKEEKVRLFNTTYENLWRFTADHNYNYIQGQKTNLKEYFNNIEDKALDDQQRTAVITDEYSNLIIAGAGSGKTLTILGKIKYLVEKQHVAPENILVLSFTKKTVAELNARIGNMTLGVEATTFHKLGYDTIKKYNTTVPAVTNENTLNKVIIEYLKQDILEDASVLQAFVEYVACYMNIPEESDKYHSLGDKVDAEKGIDFETLQSKCEPLNKAAKTSIDTLQGERVKSVEELTIANFLFLNSIAYEYERPYPHGEVMYRPDFYLSDYDIWLEHFGVDENNCAKWLSPVHELKYVQDMEIKRQAHKQYNTKLLETYSYYNRDNRLLQKLREMLEAEQVAFIPRDTTSIYRRVTQNDEHFGKEIVKLMETFINLSKSRQLNYGSLQNLLSDQSNAKSDFMFERQKLFLQLVLPILVKYDTTLAERMEIDFNDMINQATELIRTNQPPYSFQYIIIDEYQDISVARFNLIREIRAISGAKLICVGDDWQSIYRFAGSDISLFSSFGKYVGEYETLIIEQTYRNTQSLIDITSTFIQKNPKQLKKQPLSANEPLAYPVRFVQYKPENIEEIFIAEIQRLIDLYGNRPVLVLGRHSFDINELISFTSGNRIKYIEYSDKIEIEGFDHVDIKFITVHKSKGLEADNVIILNLRNQLLGFPNKMSDDPILSHLLSDSEEFPHAEERRLFYVALTRTKNEVILFIPSDVSLFAHELMADHIDLLQAADGNINATNCPYCKTGKLVIRQNAQQATPFLGCSHYPQCNQTYNQVEILEHSIICPTCKSGFMVKRVGKFGNFLGCTNYPTCKGILKLS